MRALRPVLETCLVRKSEAQYQIKASIPSCFFLYEVRTSEAQYRFLHDLGPGPIPSYIYIYIYIIYVYRDTVSKKRRAFRLVF